MKSELHRPNRFIVLAFVVVAALFMLNYLNYTGFIKLNSSLSNLTLAALIIATFGFVFAGMTVQLLERRKYFYTLAKILGVNGHVSRFFGKLKFKFKNIAFEVYYRTLMDTDFLCVKAVLPESMNLGLQVLGGIVPLEATVSMKQYGKKQVSSPFPLAIEARAINEKNTKRMLEDATVINALSELTRYANEKGDFFIIEDSHITYYSSDPAEINVQLLEKIERLVTEMIRFRCPKLECELLSRADLILNAVIIALMVITIFLTFYMVMRSF